MASRRKFLKTSAAALTVAATRPLFGLASRARTTGSGWRHRHRQPRRPRVRLAHPEQGLPVRRRLRKSTSRSSDSAMRRDAARRSIPIVEGLPPNPRSQRRRRRADRDARISRTAKITVDALAAGKDVYVEKPTSNSIPRINAMLDAYKKCRTASSRSARTSAAGITSSKRRSSSRRNARSPSRTS